MADDFFKKIAGDDNGQNQDVLHKYLRARKASKQFSKLSENDKPGTDSKDSRKTSDGVEGLP